MSQIKKSIPKIDSIEKTVNLINLKVSDLEAKFSSLETRVTEVEASCSFMDGEMDKHKSEMKAAQEEIGKLQSSCKTLEENYQTCLSSRRQLEEKVVDLESRSMRDNLMFYGIDEKQTDENCEDLVKEFLSNQLEIQDADNITFDRVHRVGNKSAKKPRPIVAKFHYYTEREKVRQTSYTLSEKLKQSNQGVGIQQPKSVRESRRALYQVMKEAKDNKQDAKFIRDKLYINGREYIPPKPAPMETSN